MILVFDTETTGKADFHAPSNAAHQPRMVQLGMILAEDDGTIRGEFNSIITPIGFSIPEEAAAIHGITDEVADACGMDIQVALDAFWQWMNQAGQVVAYNMDFDRIIVEREASALDFDDWDIVFEQKPLHCAMKACTNLVAIPGPYGFKWPKLQEAHQFFFGSAFDGAHDALADVRAILRVHLETQRRLQTA
jgi:DNA polymerase III subunit epsilon